MLDPRRTIVSDVGFGESARWHDERVWFCDWIDGDVVSVAPDGGDRRIHAHLDGFPICIDWSCDDTLLVLDGAERRLRRLGPDGLQMVADLSGLSDRPWNEIAAHPAGRIYVNGIGYDMMAGQRATTGQIAVVDVDGSVRTVADGLAFPNGMVITDGGETLVVAESHAGRLTAFTVTSAGDLVARRSFARIDGSAPDGLCVASDGTIWYADVPNQQCRRVADGGAVLQTLDFDRGCFSCAVSPAGILYVAATIWNDRTFSSRNGVIIAVGHNVP